MECTKQAVVNNNKKNENLHVGDLLKNYNQADLAEKIVREQWKLNEPKNAVRTFRKLDHEENIGDVINPPQRSQFSLFEQTYMEYRNYKGARLGLSRNHGTKPAAITNENTTFGITEGKRDGVFEVVFQDGSNYCQGLRKSEWTSDSPPVGVNKTYGIKSFVRTKGDTECLPTTSTGISFLKLEQKTVRDRQHAPLERSKFKETMPCSIPIDYTFGQTKPTPKTSVADLLGAGDGEESRVHYLEAFSALNELRLQSRKSNIQLRDIRNHLRDKLDSKYCTLETLRDELRRFGIKIDASKARTIGTFFKCVNDLGNVDYVLFLNYINPNLEYPKSQRSRVDWGVEKDKLTTYREMACSTLKPDPRADVEPAGTQSSLFPKLAPEYCKAHLINLPGETTVRDCLSPSIPTVFGLSHRDFFALRNKDDVQRIIQPVFNLSEDVFDKTWEAAQKQWLAFNDLVSIEAFLYAFNSIARLKS